jgi:hypothetical protein
VGKPAGHGIAVSTAMTLITVTTVIILRYGTTIAWASMMTISLARAAMTAMIVTIVVITVTVIAITDKTTVMK